MIVKSPFIFFFILYFLNGSGQNLDSLKQLAVGLLHDSDRVNLFYKEGFSHRADHPQYSYDCAKAAEYYALHAANDYYLAKAYNLLGILYYRKGDLNTALSYHKRALKLREKIADEKGMALSYTNLGNVYMDLGVYSFAEAAYLKALGINETLKQQKQIDNCLMNLGVLQTELGNLDAAENYYQLALGHAKKRFDYELQASCLNNLAVIFMNVKKYEEAIAVSLNSIKVKEMMDNEMEMADSYLNLAAIYIQLKQAPTAFTYLQKANDLIVKYDYFDARLQAEAVYADYYELTNDFKEAYRHLKNYRLKKDSVVRSAEAEAKLFGFFESNKIGDVGTNHQRTFPYIYLIILFSCCVWALWIVFRNKR